MKLKDHPIKLSRVIVLCLIVSILTGTLVYATSPTQPFTINRGVYPGGPSFTVWEEDGTYFAKNPYGVIAYSGVDAAEVGTAALANGGKVLFLGDIIVDSPVMVPSNSEIEIQGKITLASGSNCAIFKNTNWDSSLPYSGVDANITIRGGTLDGNKAGNPTDTPENGLIGFLHVLNIHIENVHIVDAHSWAAIYLCGWGPTWEGGTPYSKYWIQNCLIEGTVGDSAYGYAIGISAYTVGEAIITDNHLYNNEGGIIFEDSAGPATVLGNTIINSGIGIALWTNSGDPLNGTIINSNRIIGNDDTTYAISIGYSTNTVVSNNVIYGGHSSGILLTSSNNSVISGNTLSYDGAHGEGIIIAGTEGSWNNVISNNVISNYVGYGVIEYAPSDYNTLLGIISRDNSIVVAGDHTHLNASWSYTTWYP